ncbi:MAG: fatty acid desaturase family protein [Cyanobium sp.]
MQQDGGPPQAGPLMAVGNTALVRDLCAAVADLGAPASAAERGWTGLRLAALMAVLVGGAWLYWRLPLGWSAIAALLIAGVAYALLLIATHEMVHGTCFGAGRLEQPLACLLSWPMAWPYLTYSRLHRLHHRWNGHDGRDPERTTARPEEMERAGALRHLWQRQQLPLRLLVLGGVGLIVDTAIKGWRLRAVDRALEDARRRDGAGVAVVHAAVLLIALSHGALGRYLLFWLLLCAGDGDQLLGQGLKPCCLVGKRQRRYAQQLGGMESTGCIDGPGGLQHGGGCQLSTSASRQNRLSCTWLCSSAAWNPRSSGACSTSQRSTQNPGPVERKRNSNWS